MGHQIIQQPDGRLAVWSTVVDSFILLDATREELAEHYARHAAEEARERTLRLADAVLAGRAREIYAQFTMTWDEAKQLRRHNEDASDADDRG